MNNFQDSHYTSLLAAFKTCCKVSAMKPGYTNRKISEQAKAENIPQTCSAQATSTEAAEQQQMAEDTDLVKPSNPSDVQLEK